MREKVFSLLKNQKKEQLVVYILLAALLVVLVWPVEKKNTSEDSVYEEAGGEQTETEEPDDQVTRMEETLTSALLNAEGVGRVQVVITLESTGRKIVEKDTPDSKSTQESVSGENTTQGSSESREETTVYERDGNGTEIPYVISEEYPAVRGVLVIAEGGDNPVIVKEIKEAVMALFQVDAHKIKVMKMK
ncbi:MAG: stage III sporulation protein AG [Fusicatenibacter sp.]|nr:stage III sporulation protein AG [Lachnospiraceae bacterium]MDY2937407.1 stage III sporulation protein AG [Fusicatenibacter sp.]